MTIRIGIIEDDEALCEGLKTAFELEGYEVVTAGTAKEGRSVLKDNNCDLVVLDCNLPDGNGFEMVKRLREYSSLPVLMLTARGSEIDEIQALEFGVDDFMRKPFSLAVLQARVRKILKKKTEPFLLTSENLTMDLKGGEVCLNGEKIFLSGIEFRLLKFFLENRGQILSKEQILNHIWDSSENYVDENTLAVAIRRLRLKIEENPSKPKKIRTMHGMGYIWQER